VKEREPFWQQKVLAKCSNFWSDKLIGTIMGLLKLTFRPVELEKELRRLLRKKFCLASSSRIMRVSLAY
jgi:hypothetical protein